MPSSCPSVACVLCITWKFAQSRPTGLSRGRIPRYQTLSRHIGVLRFSERNTHASGSSSIAINHSASSAAVREGITTTRRDDFVLGVSISPRYVRWLIVMLPQPSPTCCRCRPRIGGELGHFFVSAVLARLSFPALASIPF